MGLGFIRFRSRTLTLTLQGLMFWPQRPSYRRLAWAVLLLRVKGKEPFHLIEVPEAKRSRTLLPYGAAKSKKDQKPFCLTYGTARGKRSRTLPPYRTAKGKKIKNPSTF